MGVLDGGLDTTAEQSAAIHESLDEALTLDPNFAMVYALKARGAFSDALDLSPKDPRTSAAWLRDVMQGRQG